MNKITFLGTGAADWDFENKEEFFRRYSSALINDNLLIDCTEHIFDFAKSVQNENLYDNVTDIIISHKHSDHFSKDAILTIAKNKKIRVGCSKAIKKVIGENENIEYNVFEPFSEYEMGKYKVTPILANHDAVVDNDDKAFHYIITTENGKNIFYGLDGAWFLRPSWEVMRKYKYDVMVFDCTVGDSDDWRIFEHNTIPMLRMMIKEIQNQNMINERGIMIASHLAHTLHVSHTETEKILNKINVTTAFDGMKVEF